MLQDSVNKSHCSVSSVNYVNCCTDNFVKSMGAPPPPPSPPPSPSSLPSSWSNM